MQSPSLPGVSGLGGGTLDKHPPSCPRQRRLLKMRKGRGGGRTQGFFGCRRDAAQCSPPAPSILQVVLTFPSRGGKRPLPQRSSTRARQSRRGKAGKSHPAAVPRRPLCPVLPPRGLGASHGFRHAETTASHVPRGVGRGSCTQAVVASPRPRGQDLPQEERCICWFHLGFKPLLHRHFSSHGTEQHFRLWGFCFQISLPFSPHFQII